MTSKTPENMRQAHRKWRIKNIEVARELSRRWNRTHRGQVNKNAKRYNLKRKIEVLSHYCNGELKCMNPNCAVPNGMKDVRTLSIDHVKSDGADHRREIFGKNTSGSNFYRWLKKNSYPEGFQVLCMNCQVIKRQENKEFGNRLKHDVIEE